MTTARLKHCLHIYETVSLGDSFIAWLWQQLELEGTVGMTAVNTFSHKLYLRASKLCC